MLAGMEEETFVFDLDRDPTPELLEQFKASRASRPRELALELVLTKSNTLNTAVLELNKQGYKVLSLRNKTNRLEEFFMRETNKTSK